MISFFMSECAIIAPLFTISILLKIYKASVFNHSNQSILSIKLNTLNFNLLHYMHVKVILRLKILMYTVLYKLHNKNSFSPRIRRESPRDNFINHFTLYHSLKSNLWNITNICSIKKYERPNNLMMCPNTHNHKEQSQGLSSGR